MAEKKVAPVIKKQEPPKPQKTQAKPTHSAKKEAPKEGEKKFKLNPLAIGGALVAGLYLWISSKSASASTTTTTTTKTSTTGTGGTPNIQTGLQTPTAGTSNPPATSTNSSGLPVVSPTAAATTRISTFPATVTVTSTATHVFSQPTVSSALAGSQSLNNGDTFVVIGWVNGDAEDGQNGQWWVSQYGDYVWTGATNALPDPSVMAMSPSAIPSNGSSVSSPTPTATPVAPASSSPTPTTSSIPVSTQPITTTITSPTSAPSPANPNVITSFPAIVTVNSTDGVNVRSAPNSTAAQAGSDFLSYNTQFEVTGYVYGQNVSGESRWWVSQYGNYVWVGGTQQQPGSGVVALAYTAPSGNTTSTSGLATVSTSSTQVAPTTSTPSNVPVLTITPVTTSPASSSSTPGFPMSVTVNVSILYVRSAPNTSASLAGSQQLYNGDTFIANSYVLGQSVSGENRWWVSQYGDYVWVGGTTQKP